MVVDLLILHVWLRKKGFTTYDYILLQRENQNAKQKASTNQLSRSDIKHRSRFINEVEKAADKNPSTPDAALEVNTNKVNEADAHTRDLSLLHDNSQMPLNDA